MTGLNAVLLYLLWMIALVMLYAGPRIPLALFKGRRMDSWERNQPVTDAPFFQRAKGAHLNCVENFPLFAALVAVAALMGKSPVVDGFAAVVLYARIAQGVTHLIGATPTLVSVRAGFFVVQQVLIVYMAAMLLM